MKSNDDFWVFHFPFSFFIFSESSVTRSTSMYKIALMYFGICGHRKELNYTLLGMLVLAVYEADFIFSTWIQ